MDKFKKMMKTFWDYVWECYKGSFLSGMTYVLASMILMMLTIKEDAIYSEQITWCVVVLVLAAAYNGLVVWNYGGMNFEMLVSGNMKRVSAMQYGNEYKISAHKLVKEYRPWKGFVYGAFMSGFAIIFGIVFGMNQEAINATFTGETPARFLGVFVLVGLFLSGWSLLPFYCMYGDELLFLAPACDYPDRRFGRRLYLGRVRKTGEIHSRARARRQGGSCRGEQAQENQLRRLARHKTP